MTGICYIVAYKNDEGEYEPDLDVHVEFDEAVRVAIALSEEAPTCDPRIVQVLLDPSHPAIIAKRVQEVIEDELDEAALEASEGRDMADYIDGLKRAMEVVEDQATVTDIRELEAE